MAMGAANILLSIMLSVAEPGAVAAQDVETPQTDQAVPSDAVSLPAFSIVELEIAEPLNSKTSKIGQFFDIRLAAPIMLDGKQLVPAGAIGQGEVIHAAKARAGGKAGELILAARYIEHDGQRIALRSFKFGVSGTGRNNTHEALAAGTIIATPLVLLITGGNVDVPAGTLAHAKTATDNIFTIKGGQIDVQE